MRARSVAAFAVPATLLATLLACSDDASPASVEADPNANAQNPAMGAPLAGSDGATAVPAAGSNAGQSPMGSPMPTAPGSMPNAGASAGAGGSNAPTTPPTAMDPEPMAGSTADPAGRDAPPAVDVKGGRIYWLDILGNGVYSALADGSQSKRIASALAAPDGVGVDDCTGTIYFSNMGSALGNSGRASVQRANWDGSGLKTLVEPGSGVNTAKQLTVDVEGGHVYFADREGAKVWRVGLDGSGLTPMVSGHDFAQLVGVAVDAAAGKLYFTDRNRPRLLRMGLQMPAGQTAANRDDVETLVESPNGAMPIDLALDAEGGALYWTDRGLGLVQKIGLELPMGDTPSKRSDQKVVVEGLNDPIGISLDLGGERMYVLESNGNVHRLALDGSDDKVIAKSSSGTGIAFALIAPDGAHRSCR